jgi:hypothetical protein
MNRRTIGRLGMTMLSGLMTGAAVSGTTPVLASWRWKSRLLLVFAPDADDPALLDQRGRLAGASAAMRERDLVVIEVIGAHADRQLDPGRLRTEYGVARARFAVILIGKDGGEKLRQDRPIAIDALFGMIDRMPMRRSEARRGPEAPP